MTMSLCGAVPHDIGFCLLSYPRVKSEIYHNFCRTPLGPLERDCDANHFIPIFTIGITVNHDNELQWGSTERHRILFSFRAQESKVKYIIIFDRPLLGPVKGIVTPTTGYQYLQVVSLSIMTMSLCGAVPRDIGFCSFFLAKSQKRNIS